MTIRQKLFAAFFAVMAVPLVLAGVLSVYYIGHEREALLSRARQEATVAIGAFDNTSAARQSTAQDKVRQYAHEITADWDLMNDRIITIVTAKFSVNVKHATQSLDPPVRFLHDDGAEDMKRFCAKWEERLTSELPTFMGLRVYDPDTKYVYCRRSYPEFQWDANSLKDVASTILFATSSNSQRESLTVEARMSNDAPWLVAKFRTVGMVEPRRVTSGFVFEVDKTTREVLAPGDSGDIVKHDPMIKAALASALPKSGERWIEGPGGDQLLLLRDGVDDEHLANTTVAVLNVHHVLLPLRETRLVIWFVMTLSITLGVWLAIFLSGRFVTTLHDVEAGAAAIARGDFAGIAKSSSDEFGRLVDSMNKMAQKIAERMRRDEVEGWRRLVRVLSHEINNTLGPVRSVAVTVRDQISTRLASSSGDAAEDLELAFRLIVDRTDALTAFIANYAELAKLPDPTREPSSLGALATHTTELLAELAQRRKIDIVLRIDQELPDVPFDRAQVERVAINVLKNAIEAAPDGGRVIVQAERSISGIDLLIEDNGAGISADARRHLFVPYFTTKPGGSGLGLALARQIMLQHGGTIVAEDRSEGGTRMRITLPLE